IEDTTGFHNLPPLGIVQQCWTHVSKPSTGLAEEENVMVVHLYPNPASGSVQITAGVPGEWKTVTLFNTTGQVVAEVSSSDESITVDLSPLPEGIYFIRTVSRNGPLLYAGKLVVVR
ncbi:MAG: T9SS type A sorting domain-containing protein, partial [Bacteroidales bacterium]